MAPKLKSATPRKRRAVKKISSCHTKPKPQIFINSMSVGYDPKITIFVSGGMVEDVVKENCPNLKIEIHDYDIGDSDSTDIFQDHKGKNYLKLIIP
jgi:hypothetical protein